MKYNDINFKASIIKNDINLLSSELVRLAKLPYRSWKNLEHIRSLDDQIKYLEEVLSAYERDFHKYV